MDNLPTLDDVEIKNKVVILRVDMNVPYDADKKSIRDDKRIKAHVETLNELSDKCAKTIVLTHQGREGDPDFIHLNLHADLLRKYVNANVKYVEDIVKEKAINEIRQLKSGEILLLDNVRFLKDETIEKSTKEHSNSLIVKKLAPLADLFVNDAFSAAHRSHASTIGFTVQLPSVAGRLMVQEINACEKALKAERPNFFIMGGTKAADCIDIMEHVLRKDLVDKILSCGLLGNLTLVANNYSIGEKSLNILKKKKVLELTKDVNDLQSLYGNKISYPSDIAEKNTKNKNKRVEWKIEELPCNNEIIDIGHITIEKYKGYLKTAKTIVMKGPAGVYENEGFEYGTKLLLETMKKSDAYTLIGGGDTSAALSKFGFDSEDFSHVSLAGGAFISYLSEKSLPAIEALKEGFQ
jgi:phosphoglycerate kinase